MSRQPEEGEIASRCSQAKKLLILAQLHRSVSTQADVGVSELQDSRKDRRLGGAMWQVERPERTCKVIAGDSQ